MVWGKDRGKATERATGRVNVRVVEPLQAAPFKAPGPICLIVLLTLFSLLLNLFIYNNAVISSSYAAFGHVIPLSLRDTRTLIIRALIDTRLRPVHPRR